MTDLTNIPTFNGFKAVSLEINHDEDTWLVTWEDGSMLVFDSEGLAMDDDGNEWYWSGTEGKVLPF